MAGSGPGSEQTFNFPVCYPAQGPGQWGTCQNSLQEHSPGRWRQGTEVPVCPASGLQGRGKTEETQSQEHLSSGQQARKPLLNTSFGTLFTPYVNETGTPLRQLLWVTAALAMANKPINPTWVQARKMKEGKYYGRDFRLHIPSHALAGNCLHSHEWGKGEWGQDPGYHLRLGPRLSPYLFLGRKENSG